MLSRISISNFKLFGARGVEIYPGAITVLIGPNGTGKSTVLQALALLKQSAGQTHLETRGPEVSLGPPEDLVHRQVAGDSMRLGISSPYRLRRSKFGGAWFREGELSCETVFRDGEVVLQTGVMRAGKHVFEGRANTRTPRNLVERIRLKQGLEADLAASVEILQPFTIQPSDGLAAAGEALVTHFRLALDTLSRTVASTLFVSALRGLDRPHYSINPTAPQLDAAGGPESQAMATVNAFAYDPDLAARLARDLGSLFGRGGLQLRGRLVENQSVAGETVEDNLRVNLVNEAFGLNQLLNPLLRLLATPEDSTVAIEEPEIHLHPRAQATLADLFVKLVSKQSKQLILTTHSEHLLLGLLNAVADGRLSPPKLAVYEMRRERDEALANRLEISPRGEIEGGLRDFLEADLSSLDKFIQARLGNDTK